MNKRGILLVVIVLFLALVYLNLVSAVDLHLNHTFLLEDSYVGAAGDADKNFGTSNLLKIGSVVRTYLNFNISEIPSNQNIDDSSLCLYVTNTKKTQLIHVHNVYADFDESTITWNNQPCGTGFDDNINCNLTSESSFQMDSSFQYVWLCWNVTNSVRKSYSLGNNVSIALNTIDSDINTFYSKEHSDLILSPYLNITYSIADSNSPNLSIASPENKSYNINQLDLNFSVNDENLDSCWWSDDGGITNVSLADCLNVSYSATQGSITINMWANDSLGNINNTESVTFYVDSIVPSVDIVLPQDGASYGYADNIALNFTVDDVEQDSCWYNLNYGTNVTIDNCVNTTFSVAGFGGYVLELFANDSLNNLGKDSVSFSVSIGAPGISLSSPVNVILNYTNITFVYTPSDVDLDSCELWGNFTGEFVLNQTDTEVTSDVENYFYLDLIDGNYTWNIRCNDTLNNIADNGNKSFVIDTINPGLVLTEPVGSKSSRTVSASWSIVDENIETCLYNVYRGLNVEIGNNSVKCQDNNASFTVTLDADFVFNFYVNDTAGNSNFSSSSFSVSTGGSGGGSTGGGGGGGSGGTTPPEEEKEEVKGELDVSGVDDIVMKPGETKTLSVSVKNSGLAYLNNCKLSGGGEASSWISGESAQGLAAGQSTSFVFSVSVPEDTEVKDYGATVFIQCNEDSSYQDFTISVLGFGLKVSIKEVKQDGKKLEFSYSIENKGEENFNINVNYWLVDELNSKEVEGKDSFGLSSGEQAEKQGNLDLTGLVAGTYTLVIKVNSEKESVTVQEQIIVGSTGLTGRAIFGQEGGRVFSIVFMIMLASVLVFFIVKRIIKTVGKHDRTHFVKHKLRRR